jgi:curved DNA-binding protein CbpA
VSDAPSTGSPSDPAKSHGRGASPDGGDPFDRLGLAPRFDLEVSEIDRAWILRAADCHPDRAGDPVAAAEAGRRSAALNEARAALRDPERRADLLLSRLGGPSAAEEKSLPPAFLTEMMELRERVEEADRIERVRELFVEVAEDSDRLREIRLELNVWRYHERLLAELRGAAGAR